MYYSNILLLVLNYNFCNKIEKYQFFSNYKINQNRYFSRMNVKHYDILIDIDDKCDISDIHRRNLNVVDDIKPDSRILVMSSNIDKIIEMIPEQYYKNIIGIDYNIVNYDGIINFKLDELIFPSLEYLYISNGKDFMRNMTASNLNPNLLNNIQLNNLPKTLKHLFIYFLIKSVDITIQLDNLPPYLESLELSSYTFNQPINMLPITLKSLILNTFQFNQPLYNLPPNLENLCFGKNMFLIGMKFNQSLDDIPDTIKELYIPILFSHEIKKLPKMIEQITLNNCYIYKTELQKIQDKINSERNDNNKLIFNFI